MQIKSQLRKQLIIQRNALSRQFIEEAGAAAAKNIFLTEEFLSADTVLCYVSVNSELPTHEIFEHCFSIGKKAAAPVCVDGELIFKYIDGFDDLHIGAYSIPEPNEDCPEVSVTSRTLCITPALCYNQNGYRIGYGKGYYDKFFAKNQCVRMGLCCEKFIINFAPDENDRAVDIIVTERKLRRL